MSDKPPIPLGYHKPDHRPLFKINWRAVLALSFFFMLCGAIGLWLEKREKIEREAELQQFKNGFTTRTIPVVDSLRPATQP